MTSQDSHSPRDQRDYDEDKEELGPKLVKKILFLFNPNLHGFLSLILGSIDNDIESCSIKSLKFCVFNELVFFKLLPDVVEGKQIPRICLHSSDIIDMLVLFEPLLSRQ